MWFPWCETRMIFVFFSINLHTVFFWYFINTVHQTLQRSLTTCHSSFVIYISSRWHCCTSYWYSLLHIFVGSFITASSQMIYNSGDKEQPCLTFLPIWHASENPLWTHTFDDWLRYRFQINIQSLQSTPMLSKICNNFTQSIQSNSFYNQQNKQTLLLHFMFLSQNTHITAIASLVPQRLLNPYWSHSKNNSALVSSPLASIFSKIFEACGIRLTVQKSTHSWMYSTTKYDKKCLTNVNLTKYMLYGIIKYVFLDWFMAYINIKIPRKNSLKLKLQSGIIKTTQLFNHKPGVHFSI